MSQEWLKDYEKLREENNMSEEEALKTIEELKNYISLEMIDNNKPKELTDLFAKSMVAFQVMKNAYNKEKEKNKELENKIKEYEKIFNRQQELEQEKNNLMKQGWL